MGKDYEILEEQYQKLVADKAAAEGRDDLSDDERANIVAGFDKAISGLEESIVELGVKAKQDIMDAIHGLEEKMATNNEFLEKSKARIEELQAVIAEEEAKGEAGDKDKIRIYQAEIKGIEKEMRLATRAINAAKREIKENNKKLIPIMNIFKDKGVFTPEEIDSLTKLEKRIERAKKNFGPKEEVGGGVTETPGDDKKETPGDDKKETPGEDETIVPGGTTTTVPGGTTTSVPGGTATTVPGGTATSVPGGTATTAPGGTATVAPAAPTDPRDMSYAEFDEIYRAAKQRCLGVEDMKKLEVIMADPTCYEKFGISTGLFRNKAKVILVAMGSEMTRKYPEALRAINATYGIDAKTETGENIVASSEVRSWSGIKGFLGNKEAKTRGQSVFEKVVAAAEAKVASGEELTADEVTLRDRAIAELETMKGFRTALDTYSEVKRTRSRNPLSWFSGLGRSLSLPEASSRDTSVEDGVRSSVERAGREATEGLSDVARDAMIIAALSSESERSTKKESTPEVVAEGGTVTPGTVDMKDTLAAGVYPPEEIDTTVGEKTVSEVVEMDTFDGPGIDG